MFREIKEWQLAKMCFQNNLKPRIHLAARFMYVVAALEKLSKKELHKSVTDRIWNAIAPEKLTFLNEVYAQAAKDKILKECSDAEIENMLSAFDAKGFMTPEQEKRLRELYKVHEKAIEAILKPKLDAIEDKWLPELIRAAQKEGITFPKNR